MFRAVLTTAKNIPTDTAPTIRTIPPKRAEDPTRLHPHPAAAAPIAITRAIAMAAAAALRRSDGGSLAAAVAASACSNGGGGTGGGSAAAPAWW